MLARDFFDVADVTVGDVKNCESSFAHERVPTPDLGHTDHVHETGELLQYLVHVHRLDDEDHAAGAGALARPDDEAGHVVVAPADQSHGAIERAGPVVQLDYYGMLARRGTDADDRCGQRSDLGHRFAAPATAGSWCSAFVVGSTSMSPMLCPCGTMGKT